MTGLDLILLVKLVAAMFLALYSLHLIRENLQGLGLSAIRRLCAQVQSGGWASYFSGSTVAILLFGTNSSVHMILGLVSAGLADMLGAMAFMFGANFGGSVVIWVLSLRLGPVFYWALMLGLMPELFLKGARVRALGRIFFALGLMFFAIEMTFETVYFLKESTLIQHWPALFQDTGPASLGALFATGLLLSILIRSTGLGVCFALVLASHHLIAFAGCLAFAMGAQLGKSVSSLDYVEKGHYRAKVLAIIEALFLFVNSLGGLLLIPFLSQPLLEGLANIFMGIPLAQVGPARAELEVLGLCVYYSGPTLLLGIIATLFRQKILNRVCHLYPLNASGEQTKLTMLGNINDVVPATALVLAHREFEKFSDILARMFVCVDEYLNSQNIASKSLGKIKNYERITDNIQKEIAVFIGHLMEKKLSAAESLQGQNLVRMAIELECIADYLDKLATSYTHYVRKFGPMRAEMGGSEILYFFKEVKIFFENVMVDLLEEKGGRREDYIYRSLSLKKKGVKARDQYMQMISQFALNPLSAMPYADMVLSLKKIRSHSFNLLP